MNEQKEKVNYIICAVYDKKAKVLQDPLLFHNEAEAVRVFAQACEKNQTFNKWPEDFQILKLAEIRKDGWEIIANDDTKAVLAEATYFVNKEEKKKNEKRDKEA